VLVVVLVLARDGDTAYPGADPVGSELGAESLPIGLIGPIGPMGRGAARWVHTRIRHQLVAETPVTPYPTGRGCRPIP
jgi:hypothetical protein